MTDDLDPRPDQALADDETTRMAVFPPAAVTPSTGSPVTTPPPTPTVPLTPASRPDSGAPVYENDVAWSTSAPVVATGATPPRRRGRLRWAAAIAVVALVIGASAAVAALLTGSTSNATVLGYVPQGTIVYGEVRLDLPGDQKQAVGEFLSKFPGFADQASLDSKLDQVLDDLVRDASDGDQTYTGNIKSWFDGELAFSLGQLPPAATLSKGDATAMSAFRFLGLVSVKDPTAASAWFDAASRRTGAKPVTETHDGTTLTVFPDDSGVKTAFAVVDGKVAVFGDLVSVKAAIDTDGNSGFADEDGPKAALDSSSGDHVGFIYLALRPLLDWSTDASKSLPELGEGAIVTEVVSDALLKTVPAWTAYWLSFENDAVVMETTAPKPEKVIGPTENRRSTIAEHIPATAIVASIANDYGKTLGEMLDLYGSDPTFKPILDQLDQGLGLVGGADAALGWVGDTAIVVTNADGTPEGGLIIDPTDRAAAERLVTALKTFVALGGGNQGITVREEAYDGTTITIVDVGDVGSLIGSSPVEMFAQPLTGHLEIAIAVTDDVVVIGSGPAFVKHVLDTSSSTSLASTDGYKKLADRVGNGTGATYVDIGTIREMVEQAMAKDDPAGFATYQKDVQPFLKAFDALLFGTAISGDLTESVFIVTVQ